MRSTGKPSINPSTAIVPAGTEDDNPETRALIPQMSGRGMVRTQTQYTTAMAVQVPRRIEKLREAVVKEASFCGDGFFYSFVVNSRDGKSTIEGPSIDAAMILLRNWGNAVCEPELVEDGPTHWVFKATFIDLETGFTNTRLFRQRKAERHGKFDAERAQDIAFQIGQSKAVRNTCLRSLPTWLIDTAMDAAHAAAEERYKNVPAEVRKVQQYFSRLGVTSEMLERKIGAPSSAWTPRDIVTMRAVASALRDRQTTIELEFPPEQPKQPEPAPITPPEMTPQQAMANLADTAPDPEGEQPDGEDVTGDVPSE